MKYLVLLAFFLTPLFSNAQSINYYTQTLGISTSSLRGSISDNLVFQLSGAYGILFGPPYQCFSVGGCSSTRLEFQLHKDCRNFATSTYFIQADTVWYNEKGDLITPIVASPYEFDDPYPMGPYGCYSLPPSVFSTSFANSGVIQDDAIQVAEVIDFTQTCYNFNKTYDECIALSANGRKNFLYTAWNMNNHGIWYSRSSQFTQGAEIIGFTGVNSASVFEVYRGLIGQSVYFGLWLIQVTWVFLLAIGFIYLLYRIAKHFTFIGR